MYTNGDISEELGQGNNMAGGFRKAYGLRPRGDPRNTS